MLGFPFEIITTPTDRAAVMDRVLDFFKVAWPPVQNADFNRDNMVDSLDYVIWRNNQNTSVLPGTKGDANQDGLVDDGDYQVWRGQFGAPPPAAASNTVATTDVVDSLSPSADSKSSTPTLFSGDATIRKSIDAADAHFAMLDTGLSAAQVRRRPPIVTIDHASTTREQSREAVLIAALAARNTANSKADSSPNPSISRRYDYGDGSTAIEHERDSILSGKLGPNVGPGVHNTK
jgi:hypothetical protein